MKKFEHFMGYLLTVIFVVGAIGFSCYQHSGNGPKKVSMPKISNATFVKDYNGHKIKSIDIMPKNKHYINVSGQLKNGRQFSSVTNAKQL